MIAAIKTQRELFTDRAGYASFDFDFVEIAIAAFDIAAEFKFWLLRGDVQRTGRSIASEQRALWTAQYFDALDWWQFGKRDACTRTEHAIDEHANGRLKTGVVARSTNAADRQNRTGCGGLASCSFQRWSKLLNAANVHNTGIGKLFAANNAYGERHILSGLVAAGCRHDDFIIGKRLVVGAGGGCFLFLDFAVLGERSRRRRNKHGNAGQQHMDGFHDVPL